ncbi:DUF6549 family protein [Prevotella sp. HUN102]|uniref:DUF6549 family protein n=1 Tax=Prevotella sp. HUN102 TaxID=1392486 RepID=UPI000491D738|nr:DUF6549 family protein [Prevotella sp. HUN102]
MTPKVKLTWNAISLILMTLFAGMTILAFRAYSEVKADRDRLRENQKMLLHNGVVEITQTDTGNSRASTPALTLRPEEFLRSGDTLRKVARQAGINGSRISAAATTSTVTSAEIVTSVSHFPVLPSLPHDSVILPLSHSLTSESIDTVTCFSWQDPWLSLSGCVSDSLFRGTISSTDTLDIIVHRVPKRFLFFRFGCREVRMDIISRNPHTRLTYARYYKLVK